MAHNFPKGKLRDVAYVRSGYAFKSKDMGDDGLPIIKIKNILPPTVDVRDVQRIPESIVKGDSRVAQFALSAGDILIAMTGATVGKVGRMPKTSETYYLNQRVGKVFLKSLEKADYDFLYYVLSQETHTRMMFGIADGSAQANISGGQIEDLEIPIPSITEQKAIAHILGALDKKIELNRRINETLEQIARAIFKHWFVDFEFPNSRGNAYKSGCGEMVNSELGRIPKGWKVGNIFDAFEINPVRTLKKGELATYLDMKGMPTQGHRAEGWYYREYTSGSRFANGDTLIARITPCLENGKTAFVDFLSDEEIGWGSTEFIVLRPKIPLPPYYGYLFARDENFRSFAIRQMTGSSGRQRVPESSFSNFYIVIPSDDVAIKFGDVVNPFALRVKLNSEESHTLITLRNTLLTKLISGKLRIKDVEKFLKEREL